MKRKMIIVTEIWFASYQSLYCVGEKKCDIIERDNYTKPKSEGTKQPQCLENKEKVIVDVLEHFGIV